MEEIDGAGAGQGVLETLGGVVDVAREERRSALKACRTDEIALETLDGALPSRPFLFVLRHYPPLPKP